MERPASLPPQPFEVPEFESAVFAPKGSRFLLMIPVINEGARVRSQLDRLHALDAGIDVAIADGGSTDGSLDEAFLRAKGVRTLLTKTGPGRLSAQMRMGFAWALEEGYEGVVTIDGNGKDGVEAIPEMIRSLEDGFDFVQGSRYVEGGVAENTPLDRHLAVRLVHAPLISLAARRWYTDTTNGFRAHSARLLSDPRMSIFREVFSDYNLHYYMSIRAARLKFKSKEIPVRRSYPADAPPPSKISGWAGKKRVLDQLFAAVRGSYDPSPQDLAPPAADPRPSSRNPKEESR